MTGFSGIAVAAATWLKTVPKAAKCVLFFVYIVMGSDWRLSRMSVSQSVKCLVCDGCVDFFQQENLGGNNCLTIAKTRHIFDLSSVGRRHHHYSGPPGVRFGHVVPNCDAVTGKFVNTLRAVTSPESGQSGGKSTSRNISATGSSEFKEKRRHCMMQAQLFPN